MRRTSIDPEEQRYQRDYPQFPGVPTCVDLLHRVEVTGSYLESVLLDLRDHAASHIDELLVAFKAESDDRVRRLVLAEIAEVGAPQALRLFIDTLVSPDEDLRVWAARGLYRLNTAEAKAALQAARVREWHDNAEAERFSRMLDEVKLWT